MKKVRSKVTEDFLMHVRLGLIAPVGNRDIGGTTSAEVLQSICEVLRRHLDGEKAEVVLGSKRTRGREPSKRTERFNLALRIHDLKKRGIAPKNMDLELGRKLRPDTISKLQKEFGPRVKQFHELKFMLNRG
jgi:hypothetical protein